MSKPDTNVSGFSVYNEDFEISVFFLGYLGEVCDNFLISAIVLLSPVGSSYSKNSSKPPPRTEIAFFAAAVSSRPALPFIARN